MRQIWFRPGCSVTVGLAWPLTVCSQTVSWAAFATPPAVAPWCPQ